MPRIKGIGPIKKRRGQHTKIKNGKAKNVCLLFTGPKFLKLGRSVGRIFKIKYPEKDNISDEIVCDYVP